MNVQAAVTRGGDSRESIEQQLIDAVDRAALRHSPFDHIAMEQVLDPATYETLLAYLRHSKLPVRHLAVAQLREWVPAGRDIAYDPAGPEEERQKGYEAWKRLIPKGKIPSFARPRSVKD